jgi:protein DGCR14
MNSVSSQPSNQLTVLSLSGRQKQARQPRHVLSEEDYTDTLSSIITRDYYPAIPSLQRDMAVLERRKDGDFAGAVEIRRAARKLALHEEELTRIEQEEEDLALKGIRQTPRPLHRESIDGFHARVTSEDNEDFERQMRTETRKHRERMQLIYNASGVDASKVGDKLKILQGAYPPLLENLQERQREDDSVAYASDRFNPPRAIVHVAGTSSDGKHSTSFKNSLFFTPMHETTSLALSNNTDLTVSDHEKTRLLMPPPLARKIDQHSSEIVMTEKSCIVGKDMKCPLVEYIAKPIQDQEKRIVASKTRFPYQNDSRLSHESLFTSRNLPTWSDAETSDYTSTDLDEPMGPLHTERQKRQRQLHRERGTFVSMTPLIIPGQGPPIHGHNMDHRGRETNASPIMTWGQVASTPMVLGGSSTTTTTMTPQGNHETMKTFVFSKKDPSEHLARIAEDTVAQKAKRYKDAGIIHPGDQSVSSNKTRSTPLALLHRIKELTPQGQRLLKSVSSSHSSKLESTPRIKSAFRTALRESYSCTPSKRQQHHHSQRSTKNISFKDTPLNKM